MKLPSSTFQTEKDMFYCCIMQHIVNNWASLSREIIVFSRIKKEGGTNNKQTRTASN